MDLQCFPRLILFDVDYSCADSPRCGDDDVTVLQGHLCCRVLVRDCGDRALSIPSCVHDPNVGRSLLVEECPVDRWRDLLIHLIGEWLFLVCPLDYASVC